VTNATTPANSLALAAARRQTLGYRLRRSWGWYLFIAPNALSFLAFTLFSWMFLIYLSFQNWNLVGAREYAGLGNYQRMIRDPVLRRAIVNTFQYVLLFVLPASAVSLGLAVLVNRRMPGMNVFRACYYLPVVTSIAVIALIWKFIFMPQKEGIANYFLSMVGISPKEWLLDTTLAMPSITVMQIWTTMGYYMVLWLAGLQSVPEELHEAARIDGAGRWQSFRYVTLPLLKPTAIFIVMIAMIGAFQVFGPQYMLTGGGPLRSTTTMVYYIWEQAFMRYRMGYAASISLLLFVLILIVSLIQRHYLGWGEGLF
jgi:multiple sugar transport system permease protein